MNEHVQVKQWQMKQKQVEFCQVACSACTTLNESGAIQQHQLFNHSKCIKMCFSHSVFRIFISFIEILFLFA